MIYSENTSHDTYTRGVYRYNDRLRIKVTDRCNMNCWFCHSEGAPHSSDLIIDKLLENSLLKLKDVFSHAHITGGEPLLYEELERLIEMLMGIGYSVSITSNGNFTFNDRMLRVINKLKYINISFHSLEEDYYSKLSNTNSGRKIVSNIKNNIILLHEVLPVRINAVVSGKGDDQRLETLLQFAQEIGCELKMVPQLNTKDESLAAINLLLEKNCYSKYESFSILPGSNIRDRYLNKKGHIIEVKKLAPYFPESLCKECRDRNVCDEGFSFFRIGGNPLYCQACIKHPPVQYKEFMATQWTPLKSEYDKIK